jgi:predicted lipid-binding transport protein (Tim44 family)
VMTPAMFREVSQDLDARGPQAPTDVVTLDADVLDVTEVGSRYVASVRFTGTLREDGAQDAKPFVEIWNLEKPVDGATGWLLAGIQQSEETA